MIINKIEKKKIYLDVATLHMNTLETGFLPSLGIKFLTLMYKCIDESRFSTLIVEYKDNQLQGFVTGFTGKSSLHKTLLYHPIELITILLPLMFNFKKILKILNILKHMRRSNNKKLPKAELLTICVNENFRRKGVAALLYKKLTDYFKSKSILEFVIVVGVSLEANAFYIKQGAAISGRVQIHSGSDSNIFIQKI